MARPSTDGPSVDLSWTPISLHFTTAAAPGICLSMEAQILGQQVSLFETPRGGSSFLSPVAFQTRLERGEHFIGGFASE